MKKNKAVYPVREWLGRYEAWVLVMHSRTYFYNIDKLLNRLFALFPSRTGVEQFTSIDIADYKTIRMQAKLQLRTINTELNLLFNFWKWLIEQKGLPIRNPVKAAKSAENRGPKNRLTIAATKLSLEEVNRIIAECPAPMYKRFIIKTMMPGGKRHRWRKRQREVVVEAAARAGIPIFGTDMLSTFARNRLDRSIIQAYCQQLLDALPPEPKSQRNPFGAVKLPTPDERPTIRDCHDDISVVTGVDEQQPSTERQETVGDSHSHLVELVTIGHESS